MKLRNTLILLAGMLLTGGAYFRGTNGHPDSTGYILEQNKLDIEPLDLSTPYKPTPAITDYFNFYDLNPTNAQHYFGTFKSEGSTLAAHVFLPPKPRGTLFLLHGYFDHVGTLSKLIAEGLAHGYAIAVWDLPGHGLSTGGRTETGAFDLCAKQVIDLIARTDPIAPQPMHLISHSTGCSIAIEYMYHSDKHDIDGYVFLSPLIRHEHWGWAKFGYGLAKPFKSKIRRRDKMNSSDEAYLAFVKKDPLHSDELSFQYLKELYSWEKRVQDYPQWPGSVLIIQGDQDDIVDWKYNLDFLRKKITAPEIHVIKGAKHQLANETGQIRGEVFNLIFDYLDQTSNP